MKTYDLSHPLHDKSPVYPGKKSPRFSLSAVLQKEGYRETLIEIESHTGTHIDAPAHMLAKGKTLDTFPVSFFVGRALIIETTHPRTIEKQCLTLYEKSLRDADFVLFKTGWGNLWGSPEYYINFPVLTQKATEWLLEFDLKGIGFDTISADPVESHDWANHFLIFNKGRIIVENLIFPEDLTHRYGTFSCYPLPFRHADGSPVRATFTVADEGSL